MEIEAEKKGFIRQLRSYAELHQEGIIPEFDADFARIGDKYYCELSKEDRLSYLAMRKLYNEQKMGKMMGK